MPSPRRPLAVALLAATTLACAERAATPGADTARSGADTTAVAGPGAAAAAVVVDSGACPFECCTYGRWQARGPVALRERADSAAPVVATVAAGAVVQARRGDVHVRPGLFVLERPLDGFAAGESLAVHAPLGEGSYRVRRLASRDPLVAAGLEMPRPDCPGGPGLCSGRFARPPAYTWWTLVRAPDGVEGWTADGRAFRGADACSGEAVPDTA